MAERRMFSKAVVNSARFLRMPQTSRLLYYDLGMAADDDGIVEAFTVIRTTGAAEDDLRVLASKGFVTVLNDDLVSFITDWNRNNYIQKDRYHPSIYAELLVRITDAAELEPACIQHGYSMDTEVRLGKDRKDKESQEKKSLCEASASGGEFEGNQKTDRLFGGNQKTDRLFVPEKSGNNSLSREQEFEEKRRNAIDLLESTIS